MLASDRSEVTLATPVDLGDSLVLQVSAQADLGDTSLALPSDDSVTVGLYLQRCWVGTVLADRASLLVVRMKSMIEKIFKNDK